MVLDNGRYMSSELARLTQMFEEHFRLALSAIKIVRNAMVDWLEENKAVDPKDLKKITDLEEKGDDLKRSILDELSKANSLMQREDLLRLVHYNDKLIDGAEIACYHLAGVINSWTPEGELKESIAELGRLVIEEVTQQREAVRFLSINIEESISKAQEICRLEKEIDILQRKIVTLVYPLKIDLAVLLRFRDFINTMEEIANLSEDAAITIRGLSLTLNT
jgi:predicted phosphate transport protein (TIGR00153 family)